METQNVCTRENFLIQTDKGFYNYSNHSEFEFLVGDKKEIYIKCLSCSMVFQVLGEEEIKNLIKDKRITKIRQSLDFA